MNKRDKYNENKQIKSPYSEIKSPCRNNNENKVPLQLNKVPLYFATF